MTQEKLNQAYDLEREIKNAKQAIAEIENHDNIAQIATTLLWKNRIDMMGNFDKVKTTILDALNAELQNRQTEFDAL